MKLTVVTHVVHYRYGGKLHAYSPYAKELDLWAEMFDELCVAAPLHDAEPPGDCAVIERSNVCVFPQREAGGEAWKDKILLGYRTPGMIFDLCRAMRSADAIHVRCPGNLGLLGALLAPLFSRKLVAKFAGQWGDQPGEPRSVRFQRMILRSPWWDGPVTVYSDENHFDSHVIPFFSSALTGDQIARGLLAARAKSGQQARRILFVGRLSRSKNVDVLLRALAMIRGQEIAFQCVIAGDGPELSRLRNLCSALDLNGSVAFAGATNFDRVLSLYEESGILVLASDTEGWPKAIVEGMSFGLIAIGSDRGLVPKMLAGGRGFVVPPRDPCALSVALRQILLAPDGYREMRMRAAEWAQQYSLESLKEQLRSLLAKSWRVPQWGSFAATKVRWTEPHV